MQLDNIQNRIYLIRDQKVMLDVDLAELYEVQTKNLNLAVKRNLKRFPEDFMFRLTKNEWERLRLQFATSNGRGGSRYLPYAFTEQGLAMLSGILNSDKAIETNIAIMRAFVLIRQHHILYKDLAEKLKEIEGKFDRQFDDEAMRYLLHKDETETNQENRQRIGYEQQKT